ncbi:MAG: hypothetical protein K9L30_06235 [Desulfobacterales bacterium]|nr:hypothetical protein [Desulfobacterales bacterium]
MNICFYILAGLFLVVIQTTIVPFIPVPFQCYNLVTPFIIYVSLFRPLREGVAVVLLLGLLMDNLSGAPFGIYLTVYFWILVGGTFLINFFHAGNRLFLQLAFVAGIALENIVFLGTMAILSPKSFIPAQALHVAVSQLIWAILTSPIVLNIFIRCRSRWDSIFSGSAAG